MGAWGPGLYSDDFAADLKTTVATLCRLPLSGSELLATLQALEPASASPRDEDHTTFWLVVADQLHRRGIPSSATERAIAVIDSGSDLAMLEELGLSGADLAKRAAMLDALRARLVSPLPQRPRRCLKAPQPLLLQPGEVYAVPLDQYGNVRNPYMAVDVAFEADSWGCFLVVAAGHALDYLAWYRIAVNVEGGKGRPPLESAVAKLEAAPHGLGTVTKSHMRRMQLELLGVIEPPRAAPPSARETLEVVSSDVSISNLLCKWLPFELPRERLRKELDDLAWAHDPRGLRQWRAELPAEYAPWVQSVEEAAESAATPEDLAAVLTVQHGGAGVEQAALERFADAAWTLLRLAQA